MYSPFHYYFFIFGLQLIRSRVSKRDAQKMLARLKYFIIYLNFVYHKLFV
jgi:hypothetical protein